MINFSLAAKDHTTPLFSNEDQLDGAQIDVIGVDGSRRWRSDRLC